MGLEPRIDSPPPPLGRDNQDILSALGYRAKEIEALRRKKVVG